MVEPLVVVDDHEAARRERELRHELVPARELIARIVEQGSGIDRGRGAPGLTGIRGRGDDDLRILAGARALRPGHVDALVAAGVDDAAIDGSAFVRNRVPDIAWSNGAIVDTVEVFFEGKLSPKSSERATRIESGLLDVANCRQAA